MIILKITERSFIRGWWGGGGGGGGGAGVILNPMLGAPGDTDSVKTVVE